MSPCVCACLRNNGNEPGGEVNLELGHLSVSRGLADTRQSRSVQQSYVLRFKAWFLCISGKTSAHPPLEGQAERFKTRDRREPLGVWLFWLAAPACPNLRDLQKQLEQLRPHILSSLSSQSFCLSAISLSLCLCLSLVSLSLSLSLPRAWGSVKTPGLRALSLSLSLSLSLLV